MWRRVNMATKELKLKEVIGLLWEKVPAEPLDRCDFCSGPIYNDGHWSARTKRYSYAVHKACKSCAVEAGLEW
jgi:hypothetical protein